jgi:hypothetical protein
MGISALPAPNHPTRKGHTDMPAKSKFFRVATEGATADGRNIERAWIEQIARNFNRQKYGARVFLEHIRGIVPGGPFDALGDVTAVEARAVEDGKLALFAQIEPLPALIDLNKRKQKLYTSAEITPRFADTGQAYLTGLAVTDNPASLGVEMLQFAAAHTAASPFAARKNSPDALFTEAVPLALEMDEPPPDADGALRALFALIGKLVGAGTSHAAAPAPQSHSAEPPAAPNPSPQAAPEDGASAQFSAALTQLGVVMQAFAATQSATQAQLVALKDRHEALVVQLGQTQAGPGRPAAAGGDGRAQADC